LIEEASYIETVSFIDGGRQLYRGGQFYWWRKPVLLMEETSYIEAVSFIGGGSQLYRGGQFY
jgi:Na+/pantothenate symporter